jgi:FMN phosphatase YigB (HAD superfamily)
MALSPTQAPPRPDWQRIHTVLLDMDGTLLDLHFDNYFWGELVPQRFGEAPALE